MKIHGWWLELHLHTWRQKITRDKREEQMVNLGNESNHWALLKFKESISNDPYDILASWNSSTHFCSWPGITCNHRHRQRITSLNLNGYGLCGSGCYGSVYKGNLESEEKLVAIKVLNLQKKGAHKNFIAECNAVKNFRHRNLVKTLTCCSTADYKGLEFKALVFEYMTNGSLKQWLHPWIEGENQPRTLDLNLRLNILFDIASTLHYLHCECEQPIIHYDFKPSNVLLDEDMIAHVSDFGLARILSTLNSTSHKQTSTIEIKGTIGYAPLEYGMGSKVSLQGDLYSFGILIWRPIDEMFKHGQNIHDYVKMAFPNNLLQIVDPTLVRREESREEEGMESLTIIHPNEEKCLVLLFGMRLACSVESPSERLYVVDVMRELNLIRRIFLVGGINKD